MTKRHAPAPRGLLVGGALSGCVGRTGLRDAVFPELFGASDR